MTTSGWRRRCTVVRRTSGGASHPDKSVAKPNYAFARRQRDLAKKQKKEEKRRRKLAEQQEQPAQPTAPPADTETSDSQKIGD